MDRTVRERFLRQSERARAAQTRLRSPQASKVSVQSIPPEGLSSAGRTTRPGEAPRTGTCAVGPLHRRRSGPRTRGNCCPCTQVLPVPCKFRPTARVYCLLRSATASHDTASFYWFLCPPRRQRECARCSRERESPRKFREF